MKNIIVVLILLLTCGCSKFLSEYSQDMVRAKTIADFDEVLFLCYEFLFLDGLIIYCLFYEE